jgi:hypothetical protein
MTVSFPWKDEDQTEQVPVAKKPPLPTLQIVLKKPEAESLSVRAVFPSKDFPPELHPIDFFIDNQSDKVEGLFKRLYELLDQAELGPIRMREGVDGSTTPSAMEHLRRIDKELDRFDSTSIFKLWFGEKAAAWHSQAEQLRRKNQYLRERLKYVQSVYYESEYSRFKLRWLRQFTNMVTAELTENGRTPESLQNPEQQKRIYEAARTWMILERGQFAQDRYDVLRKELWNLESEILAIVQQSQELGEEQGGGLGALSKREKDVERNRERQPSTIEFRSSQQR